MNLIIDNLTIRTAAAADAEQLCEWWNDGKIMAHAGFPGGLGTNPGKIRESLASDTDEARRRHIIELDQRPIGEMHYRNIGEKTAEISIKICDCQEQEKGLGTTALTIFIDALFTYYSYEKVIVDANTENKRAQHVYEKKLGFKPVALRENSWRDQLGNPQSSIDYELIKDDWLKRAGGPLKYIRLRLETPPDYRAVEELTREAFWVFENPAQKICDVHLLVNKLRRSVNFVPELDFVAEINGELAGHIIYSKSKVISDNGDEHEVLTFGPLSVLPKFQNQGVGKALMRHSFEAAKQMGFRAVIIFGYPDYYPRVGFRRAAEFGIATAEGKTFDPFMALPLYEGALNGIHGRYYIDSAYEELTQEEALEFDKTFPYKKPYRPTPIDVLLERLEPDARKDIENLGLKTLETLKQKSEGSLRALPGVDDVAVKAIYAIMAEYGYKWGER